MDWIDAAYDGEARYNHFSCKSEYGRNPLVGSFFKDTFAHNSSMCDSSMLKIFGEIKCNISLLDGIIVASAYGVPPPWIKDIGGAEAWA